MTSHATAPSASAGPGRRGIWVNVGVYLVVAFLAAGLLAAVQPALGVPGVVIELVQFAPALGVLVVFLLRLRRPDRRRAIQVSPRPSRAVAVRLAAVAGIVLVAFAAAAGVHLTLGGDVAVTSPARLGYPFVLVVVAQFVGACGEEAGWRCFLQPQLEQRFGVVVSGVLVGLGWAAWHVQVFALGAAFAAVFVLSCVSLSVVLAVLLRGIRTGRLLVAGAFHFLVNIGLLLLFSEESGNAVEELTVTAPFLVAAVVAAVVAGRTRSRRRDAARR